MANIRRDEIGKVELPDDWGNPEETIEKLAKLSRDIIGLIEGDSGKPPSARHLYKRYDISFGAAFVYVEGIRDETADERNARAIGAKANLNRIIQEFPELLDSLVAPVR